MKLLKTIRGKGKRRYEVVDPATLPADAELTGYLLPRRGKRADKKLKRK